MSGFSESMLSRRLPPVVVIGCMLAVAWAIVAGGSPPPAQARAEVLLDTITIDATQSSNAKTGTVTLTQGAQYRLEVSGTMTVSGPLLYDGLYCYGTRTGDAACQPPDHAPV